MERGPMVAGAKRLYARIQSLIVRMQRLRVARVFVRYSEKNGPILAAGLSLAALYSVFAGLYVGFTIFGLYLKADPQLRDAVVNTVALSVPGLIDTGDGSGGAINIDALFTSSSLTWSGAIALAALLFTTLGWFGAARAAVRTVFDLPPDKTFFLLRKLRDLGLVVGFGAVTVLSAAISVFSTSALSFLLDLIGIDGHSGFADAAARVIGLTLVLVLDTIVLASLFRVLSGQRLPGRRLLTGSVLGALALGILKVLGATIIGGAGRNPLLASFAVIVGLLIWFGLVCQVLLISATWIAVDMADHGEDASSFARGGGVRVPPRPLRARRARAVGRAR
ncbi:YihY/virulence factor BrkB family protein [Lacisediminihabitans profunda]|uniref:YihY/virulence factor BrkB family protein n=1 Tax=Lacisediminihabitans profunda TaxID=2594790 RepID=UPI0016508997|nr:YihY/virulence factor BrkB family protein [Lacisediminihabitans profunda]